VDDQVCEDFVRLNVGLTIELRVLWVGCMPEKKQLLYRQRGPDSTESGL
jgi:hypothetical protein